jgi:hypothetical protein
MLKRALPLFAVFALVLAACGDDDEPTATDDTTETTAETEDTTETTEEPEEEALSLDDWAEAADEVCEEADDAFAEVGEVPSDPTGEELAEILEESLPIGETQLEDIEALGLPAEEEELVEEALELLADGVERVEEALALAEDDDVEGAFELLSGTEDQERLSEIADELGLEVCSAGSESTDDTTADTSEVEFGAYGSDPELDGLYDACADGDADACDELWTSAEAGTEYYEFGYSCGGVVPEGEAEICSEVLGDGGDDDSGGEPDTYGDDPELDALWDACEDGDGQACDDLFFDSPFGSEYEEFGKTCGGRLEGLDADTEFCADAI